MAAVSSSFTFQPPAPVMPELHLNLKRSQERRLTPQTPRRTLTTSWDDIVAGRKLLKASLNAEDLNLLLESIETGTGQVAPHSRAAVTSSSSSVDNHQPPLPRFPSLADLELPPSITATSAFKFEHLNAPVITISEPIANSKLEQEYEQQVMTAAPTEGGQYPIFSFDSNPTFYPDGVPREALSSSINNMPAPPACYDPNSNVKYNEFGSPKVCTMMEMTPADLSGGGWTITTRGKEYLNNRIEAGDEDVMDQESLESVNSKGDKGQHRKSSHIKTYRCSFSDCGKTFITRKEQQNHIARHSNEPRFFCEYPSCACKYTTKSSLDLHVTRIHGEKKYKCDLCEERYSVRGDLNQHMKRKHNKVRKV